MKESDFSLKCLYPGKEEPSKESNENSMVLLAEWENFRLLFTGDLEGSGEEALVDEGILSQVDVLKVAHHGSGGATGEEFLDLVWPKVSVISVGKDNRYGHPSTELLKRLEKIHTKVYRTDRDGAITLKTQGKNMKIQKFLWD